MHILSGVQPAPGIVHLLHPDSMTEDRIKKLVGEVDTYVGVVSLRDGRDGPRLVTVATRKGIRHAKALAIAALSTPSNRVDFKTPSA